MNQEIRTVKYDGELNVEAYHFQGIMQKFPKHFHDYYVIGFIDAGQRYLHCKNRDYTVEPGDLLLFNPRDNHACEQIYKTASAKRTNGAKHGGNGGLRFPGVSLYGEHFSQ